MLAGALSLESERRHVSSSLKNSSGFVAWIVSNLPLIFNFFLSFCKPFQSVKCTKKKKKIVMTLIFMFHFCCSLQSSNIFFYLFVFFYVHFGLPERQNTQFISSSLIKGMCFLLTSIRSCILIQNPNGFYTFRFSTDSCLCII